MMPFGRELTWKCGNDRALTGEEQAEYIGSKMGIRLLEKIRVASVRTTANCSSCQMKELSHRQRGVCPVPTDN